MKWNIIDKENPYKKTKVIAKKKFPLKNHKNTTVKYHYRIFIQKKNESIIIELIKSYKQDIFILGGLLYWIPFVEAKFKIMVTLDLAYTNYLCYPRCIEYLWICYGSIYQSIVPSLLPARITSYKYLVIFYLVIPRYYFIPSIYLMSKWHKFGYIF